jgi:hypothetical protein
VVLITLKRNSASNGKAQAIIPRLRKNRQQTDNKTLHNIKTRIDFG